ncbi:MAG TPA: 4Fe-4S ferredoxin [bacterium (Candidatus Stahlbacteria)]|nr:4Fe-4S ferredoxin [Candidatus Stahlbacteria bacterium]
MKIQTKTCLNCYGCIAVCPGLAIHVIDLKPYIEPTRCNNCRFCQMVCPFGAIDEVSEKNKL